MTRDILISTSKTGESGENNFHTLEVRINYFKYMNVSTVALGKLLINKHAPKKRINVNMPDKISYALIMVLKVRVTFKL